MPPTPKDSEGRSHAIAEFLLWVIDKTDFSK